MFDATTERQLVTLREISDIYDHPNADAIELARVDGWQIVVKKGEFSIGDPCVFFEIDSFLPANDTRFEFLRKSGVKKDPSGRERIRLKTVKLRGELSQGLALPVDTLPETKRLNDSSGDLSELLDVIKYERPEPKAANASGYFPSCIPKTDEPRIQNVWKKFSSKYKDTQFIPTLKLDGSSCTVAYFDGNMESYWKNDSYDDFIEGTDIKIGEVVVCSRNLRLKYDEESHFWKAVVKNQIHEAVIELGTVGNFAIQGEVLGPGIQGNKEKFTDYKFYAFALFDIDNQKYVEWSKAKADLEEMGVPCVPDLSALVTQPFRVFETLDKLLEFADGPSINAKLREGIVWKSVGLEPQVSFKVISNAFLLQGGVIND